EALWNSITLVPGFYDYLSINVTQGDGLYVVFNSSSPVTFMIMTPTQFSYFNETGAGPAVYSVVTSSYNGFIPLPNGRYYVVFFDNATNSSVTINYINYYVFARPLATGIADYGLMVEGNTVQPYVEKAKAVIGVVKINELYAFNSTPPAGVDKYGASIQLNVVLQVNTVTGSQQLVLQNAITIYTNNFTAYIGDEVWNITPSLIGLSFINVTGNGWFAFPLRTYYWYTTNSFNLSPSSIIYLIINTSYTPQGPIIHFGYANGSGQIVWYDNVTAHIPGTLSAYILVDGYNLTDAELVVAGESNGEATYFNRANVELAMFYQLPNGRWAPPKYLLPFGIQFKETADNLYTAPYEGVYLVEPGYSVTNLNEVFPFSFKVLNSTAVTDEGSDYTLTFNASGGELPYTLSVEIDNGSGVQLRDSTYVFFPTTSTYGLPLRGLSPGNYTVIVSLTDYSGKTLTYQLPLQIETTISGAVQTTTTQSSTTQTSVTTTTTTTTTTQSAASSTTTTSSSTTSLPNVTGVVVNSSTTTLGTASLIVLIVFVILVAIALAKRRR
ncbi:MAG: thermopsin, partial [Sulfolobales archaeon]|nr:thermopsin [Sulfolobales archaeon]